MAEAFGIAAGAAGFISLGIEISKGVDTLRQLAKDVDHAPDILVSLTEKLQFLVLLLHRVDDKKDDPIMMLPQRSCADVVSQLLKLKERYATIVNRSKHRGRPHRLEFRHWREDVDGLQRHIQEAIIQLSLVCSLKTFTSVQELAIVRQVHDVNSATTTTLQQTSATPQSSMDVNISQLNRRVTTRARRRRERSGNESCPCSCHLMVFASSRFWSFEFTPPAALFYPPCRRNCCDISQYGARVQVALTRLGIRWSAIVQFQIDISPGKFAFRPAFYVLQTVPYTSAGFVVLAELQHNSIDIDEALRRFQQLSHDDPTIKHHVNPAGENYLEFLMKNARFIEMDEVVRMTKLLSEQVGIKVTNPGILVSFSVPLYGLQTNFNLIPLLRHAGLQIDVSPPTNSELVRFAQTPNPLAPWHWKWALHAYPDHMMAELRAICDIDSDLGAMTPLHEASIYRDAHNVKSGDIVHDLDARNLWGQTALHLAAMSDTDDVRTLVNLGSDVKATDIWGYTPLIYSALSGNSDLVSLFINAGGLESRSISSDESLGLRALEFCIATGDRTKVVKQIFSAIEKVHGQSTLREVARKIISNALRTKRLGQTTYLGLDDLAAVFEKSEGVNFLSRGRTLLHYESSRPFLEIVSSRGFFLWGHVDDHGESILHAAIVRMSSRLDILVPYMVIRRLMDGFLLSLTDLILKSSIPLKLGETECTCPCSWEGYVPRIWTGGRPAPKHFSMIEYLANVETIRGLGVAKDVLLSLIRRYVFDELRIPHVCDLKYQSANPRGPPPDPNQSHALEERMEVYALYEYGKLRSEWIGYAFKELNACDMKSLLSVKRVLTVDTDDDRLKTQFEYVFLSDQEKIAEVTKICALYVAAIQHEFQQPSKWILEPSRAQELHTRRLSWIVQYMKQFNIGKDRIFDVWAGGWPAVPDFEAKTHIELFNEHVDGNDQERDWSDLDSLDGYHTAEED